MEGKGLNPLTLFHARSARFPQAFYLVGLTKYWIHHWRNPMPVEIDWVARQWVQALKLWGTLFSVSEVLFNYNLLNIFILVLQGKTSNNGKRI
jgi:hypothetical protein